MAQFVAAVWTAVKVIFSVAAVKRIAAVIAINALARMLTPKPDETAAERTTQLTKRRGTDLPRVVILGTGVTAGDFVDAVAYGPDQMMYLEIIRLADHPCDGLAAVSAGGKTLTVNPTTGVVSEYMEGVTPRMWIWFQAGAWTETVHPEVLTAFGTRYTAADRGRGVCRAIVKCDMRSETLFPGRSPPDLLFAVRGARLYNPALDTSLSGTHVWGDQTTYAWTDNAAVLAYNALRGIWVQGTAGSEHLWGGMADSEDVPMDMAVAAVNACSAAVPLKAGGTEPRYRAGLKTDTSTDLETVLDDLQQAMAGWILDRGGELVILPGVARTPVATLTDGDFVRSNTRRRWQRAARERNNTITGSFTDPANRYQLTPLPVRRNLADIAADLGQRAETLSLPMIQSGPQAQRVMEVRRRTNRRAGLFEMRLPPSWQHLEAGDWITWTSARRGWTRTFMVLPAQLSTGERDMLSTAVTLVEVSADDYAWNAATDELDPVSGTSPTVPGTPSASLSGFSLSAYEETGAAGSRRPAMAVTWTPPTDPTIRAVRVEYRVDGTTSWTVTTAADAATGVHVLSPLAPATTYQVRITPVPVPTRTAITSAVLSATTTANQTATLSSLLVNQGVLATSTLTEAAVRGRFLGSFTNEAAAVTAGLQDGDTWLDTTNGTLRGRTGGTSTTVSGPVTGSSASGAATGTAGSSSAAWTTLATVTLTDAPAGLLDASKSWLGRALGGGAITLTGATTFNGLWRITRQVGAGAETALTFSGITNTFTVGDDGLGGLAVTDSSLDLVSLVLPPSVAAAVGATSTYRLQISRASGSGVLGNLSGKLEVVINRS
jgi:hypothetical protein